MNWESATTTRPQILKRTHESAREQRSVQAVVSKNETIPQARLNEAASLLHRFDDLGLLFQQTVDHLTQRDALLGCSFGQIILDVCLERLQINWHADLGVWLEKPCRARSG